MATDNYTCSLSVASIKKAKEELNEDPKERLGAVETFRQWVIQQPHLKCPTDTMYLLRFLRLAHFSQLQARKVLEKYLRNKTACPRMLDNTDPMEERMKTFLKTGHTIPLPGVNDQGRKVILNRASAINPGTKDYDKHILMKSYFIFFNYFLNDEDIQVNGFEFFMDFTGMTHAHTGFIGVEDHKKIMTIFEGGMPARLKIYHIYNTGPIFEAFLSLIKPFIPKKMVERLKFHGNNLENIYKHIPMRMLPDEYLPDDYKGPSAGPVDKLIENILIELADKNIRQRLVEESKPEYGADESKRPTDLPAASFRRLNID